MMPEYPRADCIYGWCPRRCAACKTCDEIRRIEHEKRLAAVKDMIENGEHNNG